jgi:beta-galactosidase
VPGCWLKKGKNEVVVLDVIGPSSSSPELFAMDHPVLDKLNVKASVAHNNPQDQPHLTSLTPVSSGSFQSGNGWQMVKFEKPVTGRYVALQALSTHDGKGEVCIAEVYARGIDGQRLSREPWTVKYADSEELQRGNYGAEKTFDLQESTYWRTARKSELPHVMVIDLGDVQQLSGFDYLPRAEQGAPGSIKDYKIFVW